MDYVKTIAQAEDEKNQIACYGVGKFIRFKIFPTMHSSYQRYFATMSCHLKVITIV